MATETVIFNYEIDIVSGENVSPIPVSKSRK
jgi:hypothetical protein